MKSILITGGSGFIGSNFISYFLRKYDAYKVINLDLLTYAGDLSNNQDITKHANYHFVHGDIRERNFLENLFLKHDIKHVIHFAAESHVDNSIEGPDIFIQTNVLGTFNLIDVAYKYWKEKKYHNARFHHISTDEVFGSLGKEGFFNEETPYSPSSPYSASKASSDMLVRCYCSTYDMNVVITNCSNNYGPRQHAEKLIPTVIRNVIQRKEIPIYGDGSNVRDWLFVLDHCIGIDLVFHKGRKGELYCIGSNNEKTNNEMAYEICEILDNKLPHKESCKELLTFVEDRKGHDWRYAIDSTKITSELGWKPQVQFTNGLVQTIDFYLDKYI